MHATKQGEPIKTELTPNVIAHSRREYRQFELAFNRDKIKRNSSFERKSSFLQSRPVSRQSKKERLIDVYSHYTTVDNRIASNMPK